MAVSGFLYVSWVHTVVGGWFGADFYYFSVASASIAKSSFLSKVWVLEMVPPYERLYRMSSSSPFSKQSLRW